MCLNSAERRKKSFIGALKPAQTGFPVRIGGLKGSRIPFQGNEAEGIGAIFNSLLDENPKEKKVVLGPPLGPCRHAGTLHMLRELSRRFFTDRTLEVTRNHAVDLIHAVVPVCYCDYVLLDAHWVDQVDTAASKFRAAKFSFPIAKVFSKKSDGLNRFFSALQGLQS